MWKYFLCLMSMLLTLTAWGCSLAPQPVARPVTGQQTLEAADHWRILAQQIVKEMQLTTGSSVYVSEQDRSPFGRAFTTLLRHEVAASGARLSEAREGSLCIDWGVQIIKYSEPRQTVHVYPGTIAAITGGGIGAGYIIKNRPSSWPVVGAAGAGLLGEAANLLDMATPKYPIDTEVLINITGAVDGAVTYDYSGLFYMRAKDSDQYWERPPFRGKEQPMQAKTYRSVGN